jgi:NAD(P)H-hydrate epimerase
MIEVKHSVVARFIAEFHYFVINMKIFSCEQIKEIDRYTIENEPVSSSDLMERAAGKLFEWISPRFPRSQDFTIFTGPGNNGGDGLVLARLLSYGGYRTEVFDVNISDKYSDDFKLNRKRLETLGGVPFYEVANAGQLPALSEDEIVIDAIFGSGLSRPVDGLALEVIRFINESGCRIISIDIPSGLLCEDNGRNNPEGIIKAKTTLSFQFPKLSFMFADCYKYTGDWEILPIGLHTDAVRKTDSPYIYLEEKNISRLLKTRGKFDHKGIFGHGLLVAGSLNKAGAAVLAVRAALRTGIGLITCHTASASGQVIQSSVPEAMVNPDSSETEITDVPLPDGFSAVAAGPGIGTSHETSGAIHRLLNQWRKPVVMDADAINILGLNRDWIRLLPVNSILTPHKKEFERITVKAENDYHRLKLQEKFSQENKCIVVLKGAHTSVSMPDGKVFFNSTGNPGMSTAGSGDVLTGIILSLLAQGYSPEDASVAGVYIHGLAGDFAAENLPWESIIASDIIENIGKAIKKIREGI